mmetsp:Transcript_28945/g.46624  ORF Transcript_28945/g.46624 Transcript_28945/m.46624 type:complete len:226 (+) Transcript_28945:387-1064(+)
MIAMLILFCKANLVTSASSIFCKSSSCCISASFTRFSKPLFWSSILLRSLWRRLLSCPMLPSFRSLLVISCWTTPNLSLSCDLSRAINPISDSSCTLVFNASVTLDCASCLSSFASSTFSFNVATALRIASSSASTLFLSFVSPFNSVSKVNCSAFAFESLARELKRSLNMDARFPSKSLFSSRTVVICLRSSDLSSFVAPSCPRRVRSSRLDSACLVPRDCVSL